MRLSVLKQKGAFIFLGGAEMIAIKGLSKEFKTDRNKIQAVDDLTLSIREGEIFGVIGYSGAGKSTFVRLLNRLEEPTSGHVMINNQEVTALNTKELRLARRDIGRASCRERAG